MIILLFIIVKTAIGYIINFKTIYLLIIWLLIIHYSQDEFVVVVNSLAILIAQINFITTPVAFCCTYFYLIYFCENQINSTFIYSENVWRPSIEILF